MDVIADQVEDVESDVGGADHSEEFETQPVDSQFSQSLSQLDIGWGHLVPLYDHPAINLTESSYVFGRDIYSQRPKPSWFLKVSRQHFILSRIQCEDDPQLHLVFIQNLSFNGTFVNGHKIELNQKRLIFSNDEISVCNPNLKIFRFSSHFTESSLLPPELKKDYLVVKLLGAGGFGEVHLALHKTTLQKHAIKKITRTNHHPGLYTEACILERLDHPSVIKFTSFYADPRDGFYLILEYTPHGDLKQKLREAGKFCEVETKIIFYQLAKAVAYLHLEKIVHRDLKPENILVFDCVKGFFKIKVTDFGLAKIIDSITEPRSLCGTQLYWAPEFFLSNGQSPYTNKVDIWAMGVILFQCLTGKLPFMGDNGHFNFFILLRGNPERFIASLIDEGKLDMSKAAVSLIQALLKREPLQRPHTKDVLRHLWLQDPAIKLADSF